MDCGQLFANDSLDAERWIAHPGYALPNTELSNQGLPAQSATGSDAPRAIVAAIGPEGGFTEEEVDQAAGLGWTRVGLGERILRIETAALSLAVRASL